MTGKNFYDVTEWHVGKPYTRRPSACAEGRRKQGRRILCQPERKPADQFSGVFRILYRRPAFYRRRFGGRKSGKYLYKRKDCLSKGMMRKYIRGCVFGRDMLSLTGRIQKDIHLFLFLPVHRRVTQSQFFIKQIFEFHLPGGYFSGCFRRNFTFLSP